LGKNFFLRLGNGLLLLLVMVIPACKNAVRNKIPENAGLVVTVLPTAFFNDKIATDSVLAKPIITALLADNSNGNSLVLFFSQYYKQSGINWLKPITYFTVAQKEATQHCVIAHVHQPKALAKKLGAHFSATPLNINDTLLFTIAPNECVAVTNKQFFYIKSISNNSAAIGVPTIAQACLNWLRLPPYKSLAKNTSTAQLDESNAINFWCNHAAWLPALPQPSPWYLLLQKLNTQAFSAGCLRAQPGKLLLTANTTLHPAIAKAFNKQANDASLTIHPTIPERQFCHLYVKANADGVMNVLQLLGAEKFMNVQLSPVGVTYPQLLMATNNQWQLNLHNLHLTADSGFSALQPYRQVPGWHFDFLFETAVNDSAAFSTVSNGMQRINRAFLNLEELPIYTLRKGKHFLAGTYEPHFAQPIGTNAKYVFDKDVVASLWIDTRQLTTTIANFYTPYQQAFRGLPALAPANLQVEMRYTSNKLRHAATLQWQHNKENVWVQLLLLLNEWYQILEQPINGQ
jgi:hypothetical protein